MGAGRRCCPAAAPIAIPPACRLTNFDLYQYTPAQVSAQALKCAALFAACKPCERRTRLKSAGVGDRRKVREIGQRVPRWVFPSLPGRAGDARKPCGLRLAEVAELAHVAQSAFDDLSILRRRAAAEKCSLRVQCITPPKQQCITPLKKTVCVLFEKRPTPPSGAFCHSPGRFAPLSDAKQKNGIVSM